MKPPCWVTWQSLLGMLCHALYRDAKSPCNPLPAWGLPARGAAQEQSDWQSHSCWRSETAATETLWGNRLGILVDGQMGRQSHDGWGLLVAAACDPTRCHCPAASGTLLTVEIHDFHVLSSSPRLCRMALIQCPPGSSNSERLIHKDGSREPLKAMGIKCTPSLSPHRIPLGIFPWQFTFE